jgi:hypothetical protein
LNEAEPIQAPGKEDPKEEILEEFKEKETLPAGNEMISNLSKLHTKMVLQTIKLFFCSLPTVIQHTHS